MSAGIRLLGLSALKNSPSQPSRKLSIIVRPSLSVLSVPFDGTGVYDGDAFIFLLDLSPIPLHNHHEPYRTVPKRSIEVERC